MPEAFTDPLVARRAADQLTANIPDGSTIRRQLQEFFRDFSAQIGAGGLELVTFTPEDTRVSGGALLHDDGSNLYAMVTWRTGASNPSYVHLYNNDTSPYDDSNIRVAVGLQGATTSNVIIYPSGIDFSNGVAVGASDSVGFVTKSALADAPAGFLILGEV